MTAAHTLVAALASLAALAALTLAAAERSPCAARAAQHRSKRTTLMDTVPPPTPDSADHRPTTSSQQSTVASQPVDGVMFTSPTADSAFEPSTGGTSSQPEFPSSAVDLGTTAVDRGTTAVDLGTTAVDRGTTAVDLAGDVIPDNAIGETAGTSPTPSAEVTPGKTPVTPGVAAGVSPKLIPPANHGSAIKLLEERSKRLEKIHRDILELKQRRGKTNRLTSAVDRGVDLEADRLDDKKPRRRDSDRGQKDLELDRLDDKKLHRGGDRGQTDLELDRLDDKKPRRGGDRGQKDLELDRLDDKKPRRGGDRGQKDLELDRFDDKKPRRRGSDRGQKDPELDRLDDKKPRRGGDRGQRDKQTDPDDDKLRFGGNKRQSEANRGRQEQRNRRPPGSKRAQFDSDEERLEDNSLSDESWENTSIIGSSHSAEVSDEWGGLVCPGTEEVSLLSRQCKSDRDCGAVGEQCCRDRLGLRRCVEGVAPILPDIPHDPFFGVIARVCPNPVDTLVEPWAITNCTTDDECWPRVCCVDGPYAYCRTPQLEWEKLPGQRFVAPLRLLMSYLQCTPPPPPVFDLFPKPCRNTLDCFPNLCCQEKGRKVCRPPKRSLLALLATLGQGAGYAYKSQQRNHH